jgi:membrane protease YdiL (CAAX protease family)
MQAISAYIALVYGLSIALSVLIGLSGGHESRLIGLSYLSMFLPAIAVALVYAATKEAPLVCWRCFRWSYLPMALFLMPAVLHLTMLPIMAAINGVLQWQDWLTPGSDGLYYTPLPRGWGTLTIQGLVGHIVLNALVGLAVVSFMAFFEEIGWRAWLLPRLVDRLGPRRAVVAVAILWALWHVPFELSGIQHINGVSPIKLAWVVPPGTMASGLILGWLWLRTKSVWLLALTHGALNNWGQYAFKFMKNSVSPDRDLLVLSAGSLALMVVGILLLWRDRDAHQELGREETHPFLRG